MITAPKSICNTFWQTGEWATPWTQSLVTNPSQEKEPSTVQELPQNLIDVPFKQSHVEEIVKKTESLSRQTRKNIAFRWMDRFQSRALNGTNLQLRVTMWEVPTKSTRPLCGPLCGSYKGIWQVLQEAQPYPSQGVEEKVYMKATWQRCLFLQSLSLTSSSTEFWRNDGRWDIKEQSAS